MERRKFGDDSPPCPDSPRIAANVRNRLRFPSRTRCAEAAWLGSARQSAQAAAALLAADDSLTIDGSIEPTGGSTLANRARRRSTAPGKPSGKPFGAELRLPDLRRLAREHDIREKSRRCARSTSLIDRCIKARGDRPIRSRLGQFLPESLLPLPGSSLGHVDEGLPVQTP